MGREVRMVPADWQHPRYADDYYRENLRGKYVPLYASGFASRDAEWAEGWQKWQEGLCENYGGDEKWAPIEAEYKAMRYTDYAGSRPSPDEFMPDWPVDQCTHYMMYEDTSEGTPISPAFATPEELAQWLVDTNASAFGGSGASYEGWLRVAKGGFAPSMIMQGGVMHTGVDGLD